MGINRILLADADLEYGTVLAKALTGLHNEFEVTVLQIDFMDHTSITNVIGNKKFDLILVGGCPEGLEESLLSIDHNQNRIVALTDYEVQDMMKQSENEKKQLWYVYKYQNVNHIIADLVFLLASLTGKKNLIRKSTAPEIIGFYSMAGGTGKSVVAVGVSRELARYHDKRVLFLSFEEIPTTSLLFGSNHSKRNLGDYLYYLFKKRDEILCPAPNSFVISDSYGVETFYPSKGCNDLLYLQPDELVHFIKILSDSSRYDYIIWDMRSDLSEQTMFLLNLCCKIVFVQDNTPVSRYKNQKCIDFLNEKKALPDPNRLVITINKTEGSDIDQIESQEPDTEADEGDYTNVKRVYIEKDDYSFRNSPGSLDVDINHGFGIGIKELVRTLCFQ